MKKTSFVEYYKTILQKVEFDAELLAKEYRKALDTIHPDEVSAFEQWVETAGLKGRLKGGALGEAG